MSTEKRNATVSGGASPMPTEPIDGVSKAPTVRRGMQEERA